MKGKALFLLLILFLTIPLFAEEKKISIAVMDFRANNTDQGLGSACADMLAERLFSSKLFVLMEKSQMDRIARQNGFYEFDSTDPAQIRRLGKILKVEKLLSGSITYLDAYIINVKVFNAFTGEIDFTAEKRIGSVEKIDDIIADISLEVERHYLGYYNISGNFDISAEFIYNMPVGVMGDVVSRGLGGQAVITVNSPLDFSADIQAVCGYYDFTPACDGVKSYRVAPLFICCAYKFSLARNINFIPAAGPGYLFTYLSADTDGTGLYDYSSKFHYNPSLMARGEFDIFLADRWYITAAPQYTVFFVPGDTGQYLSLALGVRMLF